MKVQIEGNLYIEHDGRQFIIKQYTGKLDSKGSEAYAAIGYYTKLEFAIKRLVQLKISESTAATLRELLTEVESIGEYIRSKIDF
ncbi:hypothetical protein BBD42_27025 [Paenibacillus sp. BIHB 4019]|uniref:DUF5405 domain-containing protein n=1 Tax=Paenibacillus sp. BIHB 4019 TaxID=1870819 RepID=A0A1B2DPV2_9BACL|nr:hypothetical protein [Paenibacillus sp. BIHB 4019]ANY69737.1 hypothetical protein BBD42_27025 [Paenibacillus sp. BIHB 4019]